jgi:hypothetical protein
VQEKVGQIAGLAAGQPQPAGKGRALRFSAIEANLAKVITDNAIQAVKYRIGDDNRWPEPTKPSGTPLSQRAVRAGTYPTERQRVAGSRQLRLSKIRIITMRYHFRPVAAALMLLALGGCDSAGRIHPAYRRSKRRHAFAAGGGQRPAKSPYEVGRVPGRRACQRKPLTRAPWTRDHRRCAVALRPGQRCAGQSHCRG